METATTHDGCSNQQHKQTHSHQQPSDRVRSSPDYLNPVVRQTTWSRALQNLWDTHGVGLLGHCRYRGKQQTHHWTAGLSAMVRQHHLVVQLRPWFWPWGWSPWPWPWGLCPWPCLGLGGYVLVNITDWACLFCVYEHCLQRKTINFFIKIWGQIPQTVAPTYYISSKLQYFLWATLSMCTCVNR